MGLLVLGILLVIVGAVLMVAVTVQTPYVDIKRAGQVLLYSGLVIAVIGALLDLLEPGQ